MQKGKEKENNAEAYLERESVRKRKSSIPSKELTTSERKSRNLKKKVSNQKYRVNKKHESVQIKVKFPAKANGSKTRMLNRLTENKETIKKLEKDNVILRRKYSSLLRKWQRKK